MASGPPSPSPPQTPTATSPTANPGQKAAANGNGSVNGNNVNPNGYPLPHTKKSRHRSLQSNIHPLGGTKFSYSRAPRPEEISPRSSESSDEEDSGPSCSPPQSPLSEPPEDRKPAMAQQATAASSASITVEATFAVEELGDLDAAQGNVDVLVLPFEIEDPDSDGSESSPPPSSSRHRHWQRRQQQQAPPDMDPSVVSDFKNFAPFYDSDEMDSGGNGYNGGGGGDDDDFQRNLLQQRQERRIRRMKSGSISKRTISERGSDSDREDVLPWHDGGGADLEPTTAGGPEGSESNGGGGTTRRLRRKTDRHSMQFSGQYFERIEELKEPNSDDEIILDDAEVFARELPYWTLMDVDSE